MNQTENALHIEIKKLREENELMRQLAKPSGFYEYYFKMLKEFKTNTDCFHYVNEMYQKFFDEQKYSSYNSFRTITNKKLKNE